ncbi:amino acid adenylation domain-containing protein, partial [Dyella mobilis]
AFVQLEALPLTPNGKLDRKALPAPDGEAYARHAYEAPQGDIERILATLWEELLGIARVSRRDNFFELGGHSLLAMQLMARLRRQGLGIEIRSLFTSPILCDLAATLGSHHDIEVPPNRITAHTTIITPDTLPLIDLTQADIDRIVAHVPGGIANIQDIYALSPLQEGILFHHLMATDGDPYLQVRQVAFNDRTLLDRYLAATQQVVDRHDILRTAFIWEQLSRPAQVVLRQASLQVTTLSLDAEDGSISKQLSRQFDPRHYRIDLTQAPLLRFVVAHDPHQDRWLLLQLQHHLIDDITSLKMLDQETRALLAGPPHTLDVPQPFRNLIAQTRLAVAPEERERFFRTMLADIDEPVTPFGLSDVHLDGSGIGEARSMLPEDLHQRLRTQARRLGVNLASLCHLAWGLVVAKTSGRESAVFGTVLFGRMHGGDAADQTMGPFINTLPLRLDFDHTDVETSVRHAYSRLAELLRHEHASLALAQKCSGVTASAPLFSALLNYRHNSTPASRETSALDGVEWIAYEERTNYPLTLSVDDFGDALGLTAQALQPASPTRVCQFMQRALLQLVDALEHAPRTPAWQLDVLPAEERTLLLRTWNQTDAPYPQDQCIHHLFERQAAQTPDAVALVFEDQSLTYAQLNARANQLAHYLIDRGICPDDRIALCVERSLAMVVGLFAVLKAGGAYVPLDPAHPSDRLAQLLADAAPALLLTDSAGSAALKSAMPQGAIDLVGDAFRWANANPGNPKVTSLTSRHLAYVIYTSGSTGTPKGAQNEHRALVNRLNWMQEAYGLRADDVVLQKTPFSFDVSVWEFFWPLLNGAKLVIAMPEAHKDANYLVEVITRHRVTTIHFVPSMLSIFLDADGVADCTSLQRIICSGEALSASSIRKYRQTLPHTSLHNLYGPTEAAIDVTAWTCPPDFDATLVPIGRPIANTRIYLLDAHRQPVPLGAIGELYIGGAGVARGYLNRPELTAERFLSDPFNPHPDARMYRSGDLARYLPDGNIEFLGRNDHQVKIRGFRIELGEIEARLAEHDAIRDAVVIAREDVPGDKRLVAYVTTSAHDDALAASLRTYLGARLPDYMVPSAFVQLEALPLTLNGKLDRKALPAPDGEAYARHAYEAPQGDIERILATLWEELLGIARVSRRDNFFELGGHSLLAMQLMARLRRQGLGIEIRSLFASPILCDLAATLGSHRDIEVPPNRITEHTTSITPDTLPLIDLTQADIDRIVAHVPGGIANIQDIYALSPLQEGILFHHLMATDGDPYLQVIQIAFHDRALLDRYLAATQQVVDRHDILRTAFIWEGSSKPAQVVLRKASLHITEICLDTANGPITDQLSRQFDPRHHRIDLTQAPLLRFVVARDPEQDRWLLLQLQHHLIDDITSLKMFDQEIRAILAGLAHTLGSPQPFRNLVAQARLAVAPEERERFFRAMLADIDEPVTPFGLSDVHLDGSGIGEARSMLPEDLHQRLRAQARRLGVNLASLCHLAWGLVVAKTSGRASAVFGTVLFGRMQGGDAADQTMGPFINTLPLRIDFDGTDVETSVRRAYSRLAELLRHEHASLALAQKCSGIAAPAPLFSALLNYRHNGVSVATPEASVVRGIEWLAYEERTNYPLSLSIDDFGDALGLTAQALQPVSPTRVCQFMQRALLQLVDALEHAPRTPVWQLDVLPHEERTLLLTTWNQTDAPYPQDHCIHHLFERQVAQTPDAIALVFEDQSITYAQLNARANQLAHYLIDRGIRPDDRIALCVERGFAMMVGLFAILKAGGAYVPLDPAYPSDRLAQILHDVQPALLLHDASGRRALGNEALAFAAELAIDGPELPWRTRGETNPEIPLLGLASHHLAYVIYTSGSTGIPKGVMVEHRHLVASTLARSDTYRIDTDTNYLLLSSIAFDSSNAGIFGTLLFGGALHLLDQHAASDPLAILRYLKRAHITRLLCVPSLARLLFASKEGDGLGDELESLADVIVAGEPCPDDLARSLVAKGLCLYNEYGPTEATVWASLYRYPREGVAGKSVPIGRPIANTRIYLLDQHGHPVPLGVAGEIHIGGAGVARGYLNRPELTAERFLPDPFGAHPDMRMYRTGDLARYLPDGNLEFLGRNDHQVKIRGFRIELGEIEARLVEHEAVREATVIAREDAPGDKRLVAYVTTMADTTGEIAAALRAHLDTRLPDYMVPSAFVQLDALPLTPNGKLDRKALPAPSSEAYARRTYEPPLGDVEQTLAAIWEELLGVERVSRHDNFFELGGHSLLAVQLMARLHRQGLGIEIRSLFSSPVLHELAAALGSHQDIDVPANRITERDTTIAPDTLPLIDLTQADIDRIVAHVPGGIANIQDIYALSPLQEGILFHHLLATDGDPYLFVGQMTFANRALLDRYLAATQQVANRHDILRTAFVWEQLSRPAQVVCRQVALAITEISLDAADGPISEQLSHRFDPRRNRIDLTRAPLLRFVVAPDPDHGRWLLLQQLHHLIGDHSTLEILHTEVQAFMAGNGDALRPPQPFRNLIAQVRLGLSQNEHERFFTSMLADIDEPTTPFGLGDVHRDGSRVQQTRHTLPQDLHKRLQIQARRLGVNLASLCHLAWGQVVAKTSGRESVVFGTVLFGRMHGGEGADQAMGLFINTLPLRLDLDDTDVETSVRQTYARLAELLRHEHASLALAQRCSGVPASAPLFSALLNYRHNAAISALHDTEVGKGIEWLSAEERTNYPFGLSVEDFGDALALTAQVAHPISPAHTCQLMHRALEQLADALERAPRTPVRQLDVLTPEERTLLLTTWNQTDAPYPQGQCIHHLFEQQVLRTPDAVALVFDNQSLTYAQLNAQANQLAHHLIAQGIGPDDRVALCVERGTALVVGLLAILKAGGAYLPLDPVYASER